MSVYNNKKESETMIRYNKLFALLALRGMKKTDLLSVISSPTLAKLSKGETITTEVIEKICLFLNCQPSDIMEIVEVEELYDKTTNNKANLVTKSYVDEELEYHSFTDEYLELDEREGTLIDSDHPDNKNAI